MNPFDLVTPTNGQTVVALGSELPGATVVVSDTHHLREETAEWLLAQRVAGNPWGEIRRVLKPGGRFVIAIPGQGDEQAARDAGLSNVRVLPTTGALTGTRPWACRCG